MRPWALVFALLLVAQPCFGRSIHVEWGYTPPSSPAVSGYVLYQEGVKVCTFAGAATMAGDCEVALAKETTAFTLTAAFADSTESPHSAPFLFTALLAEARPVIKTVTLKP